ncbi:MAG: SDR family NAD(P)-dependent oxidoreductase [Alphaproteobacteria bacterium]|nr:SDR family NAD(P)-dependent oxidoreductase [Alphaproteobacteria bacterium]
MATEDWDREMKISLYGPFYCCREFIRARRAHGGQGNVINITSVHQTIPRAGAPARPSRSKLV